MARKKTKRRRGAGRRRKSLPRTPSGRLSRSGDRKDAEAAQEATEQRSTMSELFSDRARALDLPIAQASDPISETLAGRMALKGALSRVQAEAIDEYAKKVSAAHRAMLCPAGVRCSLNLARVGEGVDDLQQYRTIMARYNKAFSAIRDAGERANRAVNIVVRDFIEPPLSERPELRRGADALVRHFGFDKASKAERRKKAA